jgi:hypothetical protein
MGIRDRFRRRQRRDEDYIWQYVFPPHIESRCRTRHPELDDREWGLVEQGLREWFCCCAWREGEVIGMPSRIVDDAWHEFILDSPAYTRFCEQAFGGYLHHTPDETMQTPMPTALDGTERAWQRTGGGAAGGSILWGLDALLSHSFGGGGGDGGGGHHGHHGGESGGSGSEGGEAAGEAGGGGDSGGGDSGGGDSGGGGCGGGGCGGGGGE